MENETSITEEGAPEAKKGAKAKAAAAPIPDEAVEVVDRFPHRRHYEEGYIFNFSLNHFEKHTKEELLTQGYTDDDLAIIREGMEFHGREIGSMKTSE